jgi:pimeloyl-ACP methyl ester carboxylesterase
MTKWVTGYSNRGPSAHPNTTQASYSIQALVDKKLIGANEGNGFLLDGDYNDFAWDMIWAEGAPIPDDQLPAMLEKASGIVIWIHGWTGCAGIWEDMPAAIVRSHPELISLVVDHNGFGRSRFADRTPEFDECSPPAVMANIERWVEMLGIRRQVGSTNLKTINFVGHSMGAAALFFLDEPKWRLGEQTRLALAPALLLHDEEKRVFFTALGVGIGLVGRIPLLEAVERVITPRILETLTIGASSIVKKLHDQIYHQTLRSITARTIAAMGVITEHPVAHEWNLMHVILGHQDPLVGLLPALNLLDKLGFHQEQIRVVLGTHYFFSVGTDWQRKHHEAKQMVLDTILGTHERALRKQRTGRTSL